MVGSALVRSLQKRGYTNLILKTRAELDLLNQKAVCDFFMRDRPEFVFMAAAKVGGIMANKEQPASFIYENLVVETNTIHAAYLAGVKKLLFLGSSCIYPRKSPQPIKEEYLLAGPLEPTNKSYALAKIAGIIMCESYNAQYGTNFISAMPTNLYGENDNFDLRNSHVLPALIRKFHDARVRNDTQITLWGTGKARRELLHVDDLAEACVFLMKTYDESQTINIGTGTDITIKSLAHMVAQIVGFTGSILWDTDKPDGTPRKLLNTTRIRALGWESSTSLENGIRKTYDWYRAHHDSVRGIGGFAE